MRYVCRFCTSHLVELRRSCCTGCILTARREPPNRQQTNRTKQQNQPPKGDKGRSNLLCNSHGHVGMVKSGETGAVNSARRSVDLVLQQIHVPLSTSTHDLVQAEGDLRDLPQLAIRTVSFRSSAPLKSTRQALMRISQVDSHMTKSDHFHNMCQADCFAAGSDQPHTSQGVTAEGRPQSSHSERQCGATRRVSKKKLQELLVQFLPPRGEAAKGACQTSPDSKTA